MSNIPIITFFLSCFMLASCNGQNTTNTKHQQPKVMETQNYKFTNELIHETSPYLLQHAHNPVNWMPWGDAALQKAKDENKLLLISIGYSACHWCHVMEHESFEHEDVAELMNKYFVPIKIDREERPDIDQIYMNAVQLMTQQGGWPLNCFALPDGKPFFGGTYFPNAQWKEVLQKVHDEYATNPKKVQEYAERLTQGVVQSELITLQTSDIVFSKKIIDKTLEKWKQNFDNKEGGPNRAPKFPIPNNYQFLLQYAFFTKDEKLQQHVELTLQKMSFGGIYDQIAGGFARYSTDALWKVPHFEKMLYDNAQLISLYSRAYQLTKKELYKETVYQSIEFVNRELSDKSGAFYSALDADSEGEEGRFYVWNESELKTLIGEDFKLFAKYYNVNQKGIWEQNNYILLRDETDNKFAEKHKISLKELRIKKTKWQKILLKERENRIRPGLDDKSLTSWNSLMLKGLLDAYSVFNEQKFLDRAIENANFILKNQLREDGGLNHSYKQGRTTINGYLEDYSFTIAAFIALYENTFDVKWLNYADQLTKYTMTHFLDKKSQMFFFTSDTDSALIARKMEVNDNVIPASNSSMAKNLYLLGHYFYNEKYSNLSNQMLKNMLDYIPKYGSGYSNWLQLLNYHLFPFYEVAICGKKAAVFRAEINQKYYPNKILIGGEKENKLELLQDKFVKNKTLIYVCKNKICKRPVDNTKEALETF